MTGNARFAQNQMSTSGDTFDGGITITSAFGLKAASASTNRFDDESLCRVVENGVLRNLIYDRYWAGQQGVEPTGFPSGYYMTGGDASLDEMIRSTERGLLVTRFWYIRGVDPRTIPFTGLSRDGTFLIENGRVSHPVKNLRYNESPIFLLNNVEMMGEPVRVSSSESGGLSQPVWVPPIKARDFTFTSLSDAV